MAANSLAPQPRPEQGQGRAASAGGDEGGRDCRVLVSLGGSRTAVQAADQPFTNAPARSDEGPAVPNVAAYAKGSTADLSAALRYRMIIHDLPRRFHAARRELQAWMLAEPPPLTQRRWDALLAATAEHLAILHRHGAPRWIEEPERFLRIPWIVGSKHAIVRARSIIDNPPPFYRHGALPDPRDLDGRGGERPYAAVIRP